MGKEILKQVDWVFLHRVEKEASRGGGNYKGCVVRGSHGKLGPQRGLPRGWSKGKIRNPVIFYLENPPRQRKGLDLNSGGCKNYRERSQTSTREPRGKTVGEVLKGKIQ